MVERVSKLKVVFKNQIMDLNEYNKHNYTQGKIIKAYWINGKKFIPVRLEGLSKNG